jgi:hypothetical protein
MSRLERGLTGHDPLASNSLPGAEGKNKGFNCDSGENPDRPQNAEPLGRDVFYGPGRPTAPDRFSIVRRDIPGSVSWQWRIGNLIHRNTPPNLNNVARSIDLDSFREDQAAKYG